MPEFNPNDKSPDELRDLISSNRTNMAVESIYFGAFATLGLMQVPKLVQSGVESDYSGLGGHGVLAGIAVAGIHMTTEIIRAKREQNAAARAALQAQTLAAHESIPPEQR